MADRPKNTSRGTAGATDWDKLHRRLEAARTAVGKGAGREEQEKILRKRAQALAQESLQEAGEKDGLVCLEFLLSYETYAVEMRWVAETYPLKDLTPLPCTPPFVAGIINVRGRILSVIDIRRFFDLPQKGLTELNRVIILTDGEMEFGILADAILGTRSIPPIELRSSLPTLTGIREEYLKGVTPGRTTVLDGAKLLADNSLVVHDE
jgi:purine-binding chemotaxis protein CheW